MSLRDRLTISRNGPLPQLELGPHLGAMKRLYQRAGVVMNTITMLSAMTGAWATSGTLRRVFYGDPRLFFGTVAIVGVLWVVFDYMVLLPSEETFNNGQGERAERSPLKRDTEAILRHLKEETGDD